MSRSLPSPATKAVTLADLSDRQAAFIQEYVARGGRPGAGAAAVLAAGLTTNRAAARTRASEMLRDPTVLQFLRDELARTLNTSAVLGVQTLVDLCRNARSELVRFSAARELVDRGYAPVMSRSAVVTAKTSWEDLLDRLDAKEAAERAAAATAIEGSAVDVTPPVDAARPAEPHGEAD